MRALAFAQARPDPAQPMPAAAELLGVPIWGWQVALAFAGVVGLVLLARTIWAPSDASLRWWALGNVAVNAGIAVTGATVRVTQSGLGCSEWPRCTPDSFVPSGGDHHPVLNEAIEFGNRTLTFLVLAVGLIVVVALWRRHGRRGRPDLLGMATVIPLGVLGQGVLGGITVWTRLHPAAVGAHFLLSMVMLVLAVALYVRIREPRGVLSTRVDRGQRRLATGLAIVGFLLLAAGVVTTGTGPLGGDLDAPRWGFDLPTVTRIHAALGWLTALSSVALLAGLTRGGAPRDLRRYGGVLVATVVAQGALGYTQYSLQLPEWLVVAHVLGSVVTWVLILRLYFGTAERVPVTPPEEGRPASTHSPAGARP